MVKALENDHKIIIISLENKAPTLTAQNNLTPPPLQKRTEHCCLCVSNLTKGSTLVEHLTRDPQIEDLNPTAGSGRERMAKIDILV